MRALPTLRQLRYLVAVSETRHFGRAAELCAVTQSTLSAGIQELETLLGLRLIERRSRRQVVFTPLGEDLVGRARRLLADAEALVDLAQAGSAPLTGDYTLGVIPTIGPYLLPPLIPILRERHPELRLFLREAQTAPLLEHLAAGRIDAAVLALPYAVGDLPHESFAAEDVVVAMPMDHPLARLETVPPEALATETLLMLEDGHCLRDHAMTACHLSRSHGNEAFQATGLATLARMVAGGIGVTLMPCLAALEEARPGAGITLRRLSDTQAARELALFWRPGSPRLRDHHLLIQALGAVTEALLAEAGSWIDHLTRDRPPADAVPPSPPPPSWADRSLPSPSLTPAGPDAAAAALSPDTVPTPRAGATP